MSDKTKIEWADSTANVINGCTVVSSGCKNCYAMKQAHRFPVRQGLTRPSPSGMTWTGEVRFSEAALLKVLSWKRPRRIFWNAHGDMFHPSAPDEWIDRCIAAMALTPQHTHQVLTKRPERMRDYMRSIDDRGEAFGAALAWAVRAAGKAQEVGIRVIDEMVWPLPNVWLGTSVEDQKRADERIPILLDTPAAVRWISAEPLLGPVRLWTRGISAATGLPDPPGIDWVVVGGESGPSARPMHPDWARQIEQDCRAAGTSFLFKQWGEWGPEDGDCRPTATWHEGEWHIGYPGPYEGDGPVLFRSGKRAAGRLLDGVQHDGYPKGES